MKKYKIFKKFGEKKINKKSITKLVIENGKTIVGLKELLKEEAKYYSELYTSNFTDDAGFKYFLPREFDRRLSVEDQNSCEGLLNESECAIAL